MGARSEARGGAAPSRPTAAVCAAPADVRAARAAGAEEERDRIAATLHGTVAPALAYVGFEIDRLVAGTDPGPRRRELEALRRDLTAATDELRVAVAELRPAGVAVAAGPAVDAVLEPSRSEGTGRGHEPARAPAGAPATGAPAGDHGRRTTPVVGSWPGGGVADDGEGVTPREAEVLQLLTDGCSPPEVARRLSISPKTVKNHLGSIYSKLGVGDRTQAVLHAVRLGVVELR